MSDTSPDSANVLYGIARNLLQELDYGELLTNILDMTIQALGADRGCVVAREKGGFRATAARNFRNETLAEREREISTTIAGMAVEEGRVLLVNDAQESAVLRDKKSVRRLQLRSVLCAPLIVSNEAFAVIYLENRELSARFNERHEQLLSEICVLAAPRLHPGSADHAAIALAASVCGAGDWFHSTRVPRSCDRVPWSLVTSNPQFVFRLLSPIENASLVGEGLARATTGSAVGARTSRSGIATRRTA